MLDFVFQPVPYFGIMLAIFFIIVGVTVFRGTFHKNAGLIYVLGAIAAVIWPVTSVIFVVYVLVVFLSIVTEYIHTQLREMSEIRSNR